MNLLARAKLAATHLTFPSPAKPTFTKAALQHLNRYATEVSNKKDAVGDLWRDLVKNPLQWYDYRAHKLNLLVSVKHPDFKRKDGDEVLWVNTIPPSMLPEFENLKFDVKDVPSGGKKAVKGEDLWKSLLEDPTKWCDNRVGKKNPKSPDFVHRESKEALWISSAPSSVKLELEGLRCVDKDDVWKSLLEDPRKWWDNRVGKKNPKAPDFKHKETGEALWINDAPSWVIPELEYLRSVGEDVSGGGGKNEAKRDDLWKSLVEDPKKWWDNRSRKTNPKSPDFKHKESIAPSSVIPELEGLRSVRKDDSWKNLVEDPSKWWDKRQLKTNPKAPDFVHKESKEALWVSRAPTWALTELENLGSVKNLQLEGKKEAKGEDSWKSLLEDPSKWWDNRSRKTSPKAPDFKHKESKEALWISSAPTWALTELENLGSVKNLQLEGKKEAKGEDSWKSLVEDPTKWWDNRVGKKNPKSPDFKHKESGEALWANNIPDWVLAQLPPV